MTEGHGATPSSPRARGRPRLGQPAADRRVGHAEHLPAHPVPRSPRGVGRRRSPSSRACGAARRRPRLDAAPVGGLDRSLLDVLQHPRLRVEGQLGTPPTLRRRAAASRPRRPALPARPLLLPPGRELPVDEVTTPASAAPGSWSGGTVLVAGRREGLRFLLRQRPPATGRLPAGHGAWRRRPWRSSSGTRADRRHRDRPSSPLSEPGHHTGRTRPQAIGKTPLAVPSSLVRERHPAKDLRPRSTVRVGRRGIRMTEVDMTGLATLVLARPLVRRALGGRAATASATPPSGSATSAGWRATSTTARLVPEASPATPPRSRRACYGNDPESCRVYGGLYTVGRGAQRLPGRLAPAAPRGVGDARRPPRDRDRRREAQGTETTFRPSTARTRWASRRCRRARPSGALSAARATGPSSGPPRRTAPSAPPRPPSTACGTRSRRATGSVVFDDLYLKENAFSVRCLPRDPHAVGDPSRKPSAALGEPGTAGPASPASRQRLLGARRGGAPRNVLCIVCEDISPRLGSYGDPWP